MCRARIVLILLALWPMQAIQADEPGRRGMLWQVEGSSNVLYLLGSVHMLRPQDYPLAQTIEDAYEDAEVLVMELDTDELDPVATARAMYTHGRLPEGKSLEAVLGPEDWRIAYDAAAALGVDLAMLNQVKPWWAALTILQLELAKLGFDPRLGLEGYFTRRAGADGKPIEGLETASFQIALFDGMTLDQQADLLLKSLQEAASLETDMSALLAAWREGETETLAAMQSESFDEFPALYGQLIRERNRNWAKDLASLLDDRLDYLVVVGALHLVGEDSVVRALEAQGFTVQRK